MEIKRTDLSEPEVIALIELHGREMDAGSPEGTCHFLDLSGLKVPEVEVYAAWAGDGAGNGEGDRLLSIGALKHHDGFGELKSMRAHPDARGTGAGKAMLVHLIERARDLGFTAVKLETGSGEVFEAAVGLYKSFGFEPCGSFGGYEPGEFNKLYSLDL